MKITIDLDVNLSLDEVEDFMEKLSNDICNGDTSLGYEITLASWDWRD
jgi:hypothetical protein